MPRFKIYINLQVTRWAGKINPVCRLSIITRDTRGNLPVNCLKESIQIN